MNRLTMGVIFLGLGSVALACGDDGSGTGAGGEGGAGSTTTGTAAGTTTATSSSTATGTTTATSSSSTSTTSSTSSGGGGGAGGGTLDPQSTACVDFPATVTLGETIDPTTTGAILCYSESTESCRLTTNTYSDGTNPCPAVDSAAGFFAAAAGNRVQLPSTWTIESSTAGTIDATFPYYMTQVPTGQAVTTVIRSPSNAAYTVVYSFDGAGQLTMTSFVAN